MTAGVTRRLADAALGYRFEALPPEVTALAGRCILDSLGCALAGLSERASRMLLEEVAQQGGRADAIALGADRRVPAGQAAMANATAAHALDYDDVNVALPGHVSAVVMPAALAVAEAKHCSGRELVTAFVAAYETACRVGLLVAPAHYDRGYHATSTIGAFGAAAAAGRLLGLSAPAMANAFGLAATQASGLKGLFGTMAKPLHAGLAARAGILAATLASRGFAAGEDAIEKAQGFAATLGPGIGPEHAFEPPSRFFILDNLFKYHAACYGVHAAIDCGRELAERHAISPESITRVTVVANPASDKYCNIATPADGSQGKFSLRANAAFGLLGVDTARLDAYSGDLVTRPDVVRLRDLTTVAFDAGLAMMECVVSIETGDGRSVSATRDAGKAEADRAQQARRVEAKFDALAAPVVGAELSGRLKSLALSLEAQHDLADFANALAAVRVPNRV